VSCSIFGVLFFFMYVTVFVIEYNVLGYCKNMEKPDPRPEYLWSEQPQGNN
jgi:hypothetical protein